VAIRATHKRRVVQGAAMRLCYHFLFILGLGANCMGEVALVIARGNVCCTP